MTEDAPASEAAADLALLREEEKLARDVYLQLYERWGLRIFENISGAEQRHMDQVGSLLDAYDIADPIVDDTVGAFTHQAYSELFAELVVEGQASEVDALRVGATIEDLDIYDIEEMATRTDDPATLDTYAALVCGSRNHMRAFAAQLQGRGESYQAQFITPEYLMEILSTPSEKCGQGQ